MGSTRITAIRRQRETSGHPEFQYVSPLRALNAGWPSSCRRRGQCSEVRATSQMASLVSKIADFSHIMNAQLRMRGKARTPFSVRLRGRVQFTGCGEVLLGEGVSLSGTVVPIELVTYTSGRIEIGNHTFVNYGSSIAARTSVKIGSYCHLGHYTFVMDNDQHDVVRHTELPQSEPVIIEDHVWIGSKAVILPGVRIGSRAVIGAGSIVTKDIPARCVAAGNPARVLRHLTELD